MTPIRITATIEGTIQTKTAADLRGTSNRLTKSTLIVSLPRSRAPIMWRTLFKPNVLFSIAVVQALSPYLLWKFGTKESQPIGQDLNYIPILVWIIGWVSFLIGGLLVSKMNPVQRLNHYQLGSHRKCLIISLTLLALVICQIYMATLVYGTLPLLSYLRQDKAITVGSAVALQDGSFVGQFASLRLTIYLLCSVVCVLLLRTLATGRKSGWLVGSCLTVMAVGASMNGKRGDLVRLLVTIFGALAIATGDPIGALMQTLPMPKRRYVARLLILGAVGALLFLFGYLGTARNQGLAQQNSVDELINYQSYPILNMEAQCASVGLGPYEVNLALPFQRLVPYKIANTGEDETYRPPRVIASSPAGLFENVQWSVGPLGIVAYSLVLGILCNLLFQRATSNLFCLLAYSQCITSILFAHTVDEFSILLYVPAPLGILLCLTVYLGGVRLRPLVKATGGKRPPLQLTY